MSFLGRLFSGPRLAGVGAAVSRQVERSRNQRQKRIDSELQSMLFDFQQEGDVEGIQELLRDKQWMDVSPNVKRGALNALQTATHRMDMLNRQTMNQFRAHEANVQKLGAEGFDVETSSQFGGEEFVADDNVPEGYTFDKRPEFDPTKDSVPFITKITPGPHIRKMREAQLRQAQATASVTEGRAQILTRQIEDLDKREDRIGRAVMTMIKGGKIRDTDLHDEAQMRLAEMGISLEKRRMPQAFIQRTAELKSAMKELRDLQSRMVAMRSSQGPWAGWAALIPGTQARILQAHIDRVRQRIGKALEGGVLRKEDEEKYKKILPTIYDTQNVSDAKVNGLMGALQRDLQTMTAAWQQLGGSSIDDPELARAVIS